MYRLVPIEFGNLLICGMSKLTQEMTSVQHWPLRVAMERVIICLHLLCAAGVATLRSVVSFALFHYYFNRGAAVVTSKCFLVRCYSTNVLFGGVCKPKLITNKLWTLWEHSAIFRARYLWIIQLTLMNFSVLSQIPVAALDHALIWPLILLIAESVAEWYAITILSSNGLPVAFPSIWIQCPRCLLTGTVRSHNSELLCFTLH